MACVQCHRFVVSLLKEGEADVLLASTREMSPSYPPVSTAMPSIDVAPQQDHKSSVAASSRSSSPAAPSHHGQPTQRNEPMKRLFFDKAHNTPAGDQLRVERDDDDISMSDVSSGPSRPITPLPAQEDQDELEVEGQLHDNTPLTCNICAKRFSRVQERNRHIESYLPHSILCPYPDCSWTGRRQWDFKEHWRRKHPEGGRVPGEADNEIYDPKEFVRSIVDGTPVAQVARSAFAEVQANLGRLGKSDLGENVLGRNKELRKWIRTSSY